MNHWPCCGSASLGAVGARHGINRDPEHCEQRDVAGKGELLCWARAAKTAQADAGERGEAMELDRSGRQVQAGYSR